MAKEIDEFVIIIRGTRSEGPTSAEVSYRMCDSTNKDLRSRVIHKPLLIAALRKKLHDTGASGEGWADAITAAESDEAISV